jgi:arylsulfatase A-like enzyme
MIMKWKDVIQAGTEYSEQVSLLDVVPTVLASAAVSHPSTRKIDGVVTWWAI